MENTSLNGGFAKVDTRSPEAVRVADAALNAYNQQLNSHKIKYRLLKITKAERQIVAGYNYRIEFEASEKTNYFLLPLHYVTCLAEVWQQITHELKVRNVDCKPKQEA